MEPGVVYNKIVNEVLNEDNYEDWSVGVKTYLVAVDLWDVVKASSEHASKLEDYGDDEVNVPADSTEFKKWRKKNAKALHAIQISCGAATFGKISGINTAKRAWDNLEEAFGVPKFDLPHHDAQTSNGDDVEKSEKLKAYEIEELFKHVNGKNWEAVKEFVNDHPNAVKAKDPSLGCTALHTAARVGAPEDVVEYLLRFMTEKDLEVTDPHGFTAFAHAIERGNIQMVHCMIQKNNNLSTIRLQVPDYLGALPLLFAYRLKHREIARYLYFLTPVEHIFRHNGHAAQLSSQNSFSKKFAPMDIAYFIHHCPSLAIAPRKNGFPALHDLANMSSGFLSRKRLTFWQRWIYDRIDVQPASTGTDICLHVQKHENEQPNQKNLIHSVMNLFQRLIKGLYKLSGIKSIYRTKFVHTRNIEFLDVMCEDIKQISFSKVQNSFLPKSMLRAVERGHVTDYKYLEEIQNSYIRDSIFRAVEKGHVDFLTHIFKANLELMNIVDEKRRNIFQFAIECRQEEVYSLLYRLGENQKNSFAWSADKYNNTMLHSAARLSPFAKLNHIRGAILQMQRELQWFQEVESFVPARISEILNYTDHMTPRELFTENHKELVKKAESSMKETATSYTVVGALIVTIMFAAAFTVPGEKGDILSMVYIVSDAISFFTSTISVMIFLGLLTSRYAEQDFLRSLPRKMILGLFFLWYSIATMMIAFSTAIAIRLHGKTWLIIPTILLASAPITTFIWMQASLFIDIFISTYVSRIFDKKDKPSWPSSS